MEPLEKLRAQRLAKDNEITRLMGLPVAEKRDATVDEVKAIAGLDDELVALDDAITRAERREADKAKEAESRGVRSKPPGAPAAGTAQADRKPYSIMRAIRLAAEGRPLDGVEGEVHQEIVRRSGGRVFKGFAMPTSNDPEIRALMFPGFETRDLTTTTGAGTIFNIPKSFVELLRAKLVIRDLGVEILTDMQGIFSIPRQTGTNTVQWVGEGASITPTNPTFDQIPFTPKLAIASTIISKQFMMQSSIDVEAKVTEDLAKVLALEFDRVVINGSGGAQPTGILNNSTIQSLSTAGLPPATNGGPMTYARAVAMETLVNNANVGRGGKRAYLLNPTIKGALKNAFVGTAGFPIFVYGKGTSPDMGEINGYPAYDTTQVPGNLTQGSSSNASVVIFGNWGDLTVAMWSTGVDVIIDPYTGKRAGAIEITMEMAMDSHPTHEQSFAVAYGVTPT